VVRSARAACESDSPRLRIRAITAICRCGTPLRFMRILRFGDFFIRILRFGDFFIRILRFGDFFIRILRFGDFFIRILRIGFTAPL